MTGFVFSFCLLFRWGIMHRVLLVVGWCWVFYSSRFLCVSSHYLILPRISSLVLGSWSQWSHSKGSGLDLEFCVVLYIRFHWSGTPVHSQLVFCIHYCVWRCIADVSMGRDVLHIHLLLHHLQNIFWIIKTWVGNVPVVVVMNRNGKEMG